MKDIKKIQEFFSKPLNEEETAIDMAKKQLDQLGAKYEMSGNKFKPFKAIYKPIGKSDDWYDKFDEIVYLFNLGSAVKSSMSEASPLTKLGRKIGWAGEDWTPQEFAAQIKKLSDETLLKWAEGAEEPFGKGIPNTPLAFQQKLVKIELAKRGLTEAKEEDAVDTITMDIPLFLRMLEYSREDAAQDVDLHDVTEKANTLGKERGILQMDDYNEIVGAAEDKIEEAVNLKASKLSTSEYQKVKKLKDFKASDWKYDSKEDLYIKSVKEATDYMKRRKAMDDYATSKKDKPAKSYNPKPSGKTDYMKRREKDLTETIFSKLTEKKSTPCWNGYKQIGMKEKDGKQVPNCVPKK